MIRAEWLYWIVGLFFLGVGVLTWLDRVHPKRLGSGAFWTLLGLTFPYGTFVVNGSAPPSVLGVAVIAIAVLAGFGFPGRPTLGLPAESVLVARAKRFGWRLFLPALAIPVVAVIFGSALPNVHVGDQLLIEKGSATLVGLVAGSVVALIVAMAMLHVASPVEPMHEGRRLLGQIGWAAVLPQLLATLGVLFTAAGVGKAVGRVAGDIVPTSSLVASVGVYCLGMALFTIVMGNAFAAFPIMTAAIGWPILVQQFDGNPVVIFAVGMLAGFCGTLCTPMAANFNLVPSALLEMKDRYGVIKAQVPTAVPLLVANAAIIYLFAF